MARLKDTILGNFAQGKDNENNEGMLDISQMHAGQNGYMPQLEGFVSNTAYIRRNLIAVLVEAPTGFSKLPEPERWVATLKSLVEVFPNSIEGLNSTLEVEFAEEAVGGAGEMQETLSNVTRTRSTPSFTWTEKYGKPINTFFTTWITGLMMDPNTKVPNVMARGTDAPTDVLPDFYTMTVMFIEPDPTHTRVVHAWLSTNMAPKTAGEVIGSRDLTSAGEVSTYSIEFTALTQDNPGVKKLAQEYLDSLNRNGLNPNTRPAFVEAIQEDVKAADRSGLVDTVEEAAGRAIDPNDRVTP